MYFESVSPRFRIYSLFVPGVSKTVLILRMDKRKSFVFPRQYRSCFSQRIIALLPRNSPIKTAVGIVTHDLHGLKKKTLHHVSGESAIATAGEFELMFTNTGVHKIVRIKKTNQGNPDL